MAKPRSQSNESHNQEHCDKANPSPEYYTHHHLEVRQDVVRAAMSIADQPAD
ncbi:MAG: hypothetical protein M3P00_02325 [Gemmatimonadota bacterium]|nr:hypothetical protein [Gemmatimonadota bacterium]